MGKLASLQSPKSLKNWAIKKFIRRYGVNLHEAIETDYQKYLSFNDFFSRRLKPDARLIDADISHIISPADGKISEIGHIKKNSILQAKNHAYTLENLLGGEKFLHADLFENGKFITIYLSPKDYHRVHIPIKGKLLQTVYIPGKFFSVNPATVESVPDLFAKNERVITFFDTASGKIAVIFVGAMIVGSIVITAQEGDTLEKGQELGYFQLGSTVIVLFQENKIHFQPGLTANCALQMGQKIADIN